MTGQHIGDAASHDHTITDVEAAVAFIDLSGFTALTEVHGDRRAAEIAEEFADLTSAALGEGDRLVKVIGDAVLVTSASPQAVIDLIRRLTVAARDTGRFPVLRAGIHFGPLVTMRSDVYGGTVNIAARLAAAAGPAQVLCTRQVAETASAAGLAVNDLGLADLRNLADPLAVFGVDLGIGCPCGQVDPVCRMRLADETTTSTRAHHGVQYRFCSAACAERFAGQPELFLENAVCFDDAPARISLARIQSSGTSGSPGRNP